MTVASGLVFSLACEFGREAGSALVTDMRKAEEAVASERTSLTEPKTGRPRCSVPAFFGLTPPTSFVPNSSASLQWKVACTRE